MNDCWRVIVHAEYQSFSGVDPTTPAVTWLHLLWLGGKHSHFRQKVMDLNQTSTTLNCLLWNVEVEGRDLMEGGNGKDWRTWRGERGKL